MSTYSKLFGFCADKFELMKSSFEYQRNLLKKTFYENESFTLTSYQIMYKMAEPGKSFTDGNFIIECILEAENDLCFEKATFFGSISHSASSIVRRTHAFGENIVLQIRTEATNLFGYSLALDESTDLLSTSHSIVFIRGIDLRLSDHRGFSIRLQHVRNHNWKTNFQKKCRKLCKAITFSESASIYYMLLRKTWLE